MILHLERCRSGLRRWRIRRPASGGTSGGELATILMHKVYVLWSEKLQKRYVGSTANLARRMAEHNRGGSKFSKGGIPWILLYEESCSDVHVARMREGFLKSGAGRTWLDALLAAKKNL